MIRTVLSAFAMILVAISTAAFAMDVIPLNSQSSEQTQQDINECQGLAKQSTDSSLPAAQTSEDDGNRRGDRARLRGARTGAVAGAAAAEARLERNDELHQSMTHEQRQDYRHDQAASTAVAGAVVRGSQARRERRRDEKESTQASMDKNDAYTQAYHGCLLGRGYKLSP